jgi:hypothetical protein
MPIVLGSMAGVTHPAVVNRSRREVSVEWESLWILRRSSSHARSSVTSRILTITPIDINRLLSSFDAVSRSGGLRASRSPFRFIDTRVIRSDVRHRGYFMKYHA